MKKIIFPIVATLVIGGLNIWTFLLTNQTDLQFAWVSVAIVWIDLVIAWLINKKQPSISYMFFATGIIIDILLLVNYFWIQNPNRLS